MGSEWTSAIARSLERLLAGPAFPDREYVRAGATFAEVYAMAGWLRERLAAPDYRDRPVCLAADSKAVIAAALLAALSGGPPLLLPYGFSGKALRRLQQATGFVTAIAEVARDLPTGVELLCPEAGGDANLEEHSCRPPGDRLLQLFTGGSTGTPQVWTKTCANIFGEFHFLAETHQITGADCILATIPAYHIYGLLFAVGMPLVGGATVIDPTPTYPKEIVQLAEEQRATVLVSVPPHYRALQQERIRGPLRLAFSSAGPLDPADNERFCRNNRVGVVEVYGSTETGGIATRNRFLGEDHFRPFSVVDWRVVADRLAIRSPFISPELALDAQGFFLANDRVAAVAGGRFALRGRADAVTKVAGKRVDLEEVRLLVKGLPGVVECMVVALPDESGRQQQIGALVQGEGLKAEGIRQALGGTLESYALPRRIRIVDRLPVQANGKFDRAEILRLLQQ